MKKKPTNQSKTHYLVCYQGGEWDDVYTANIFVTPSKTKATKYVTKFNEMLNRWMKYYYEMREDERYDNRHQQLRDISSAYFKEIEVR